MAGDVVAERGPLRDRTARQVMVASPIVHGRATAGSVRLGGSPFIADAMPQTGGLRPWAAPARRRWLGTRWPAPSDVRGQPGQAGRGSADRCGMHGEPEARLRGREPLSERGRGWLAGPPRARFAQRGRTPVSWSGCFASPAEHQDARLPRRPANMVSRPRSTSGTPAATSCHALDQRHPTTHPSWSFARPRIHLILGPRRSGTRLMTCDSSCIRQT